MSDANPYQSPDVRDVAQDDAVLGVEGDASRKISPIDRILVHIHDWRIGTNLLGLLLALVFVFALWGIVELTESLSRLTAMALFLTSFGAVGVADVLWRLYRSRRNGFRRLILPFEGGAIGYIPIWLWMFGSLLLLASIALARLVR
jgi:hypothetical protein